MKNFETQINALVDLFRKDYAEWCDRANITSQDLRDQDYRIEEGRSYIKIVMDKSNGQSMVAGFVCKKDNPKKGFVVGDMFLCDEEDAKSNILWSQTIYSACPQKHWDIMRFFWASKGNISYRIMHLALESSDIS